VFVHKSIIDEFSRLILERVRALRVGDPQLKETRVGALISKPHMEKVLGFIDSAKKEGAKVLVGGEKYSPTDERAKNGYFVAPTVIGNVTDEMKVIREEIFGPVMCLHPSETEDEVIRRANATTYGLAGGVFTKDIQRAHRVAAKLQAGVIWINNYNQNPVEMPFGGYKSSGFGRELGAPALHEYTQVKSVYVEMNDVASDI